MKAERFNRIISIMYYEKTFYSIIETGGEKIINIKLHFLKESGGSFQEINQRDYPKEIVFKNIFFPGEGYLVSENGKIFNNYLSVESKRDPDDVLFRISTTVRIWKTLISDLKYSEVVSYSVDAESIRKYLNVYKPINIKIEEMILVPEKEVKEILKTQLLLK